MLISLASFLAGGLIVGALALFNLSVSSDLPLADNRILIPPVLVGGIVGVIISVFVLRNRKIFVGKLEVERRATEKLKFILDQNRELFRNLFADAGVGMNINSLDGKFLEVNNAFCSMLGYSNDELLALSIADITPPEDRQSTVANRQESIDLNIPVHSREKRYMAKDGSDVWGYLTRNLVKNEDGLPSYYVSIIQDISARKKAEFVLKESEERFFKAFQANPIMQSITRLEDGVMVDVNKAWANTLGFTREEAVGKSAKDLDLVVDFDNARRAAIIDEILNTKKPNHFSGKLKCKNGDILEFDVNADILEIGGVKHLLLASTDVTDQKRREEQLSHSLKMESVGQLTGGLAHDFNNLLAAALGNIELLREEDADPLKFKERLESTRKAILSGANLTKRLLAFSRKQSLNPEVIDASKLVNSTFELLRRTLARNILIELDTPKNLWPIFIDANQLENALINLALNSRDAMMAGGTLSIKCANTTVDKVHAEKKLGLKPGDYVTISVTDTGMGIQKSLLRKVVEPFFTTKPIGEGSGLGLSMIYGFVKQSDGYFDIQSQPNEGTTVTLYLSRDLEIRSEMIHDPVAVEMPHGNGETVLVIEDEPDVREITITLLENLGYKTLDGGDGRHIAEILDDSNCQFDFVISDVVLSNEISGPELADQIIARKGITKILLMTGYAEEDVIKTMDGVLKFPVINKPFTKTELAQKVHAVMNDAL